MTTSKPREYVERALGLLAGGLRSLSPSRTPQGAGLPEYGDVQAQLKAILADWDTGYRERVPRGTKTRVHELLDLRNKWAHPNPQDTLNWSDAYRAANSALQLLRTLGGTGIQELENLENELIAAKPDAPERPIHKLRATNIAELWLEAEPDSASAMHGTLRCPSCSTTFRVVVKRNPDALTDKRPRFLLFDGTAAAQPLQVGHLFVGKILTSPVLYFGAVHHCGEQQRVVGFFNRTFNTAEDPHIVLVPHAPGHKTDEGAPF